MTKPAKKKIILKGMSANGGIASGSVKIILDEKIKSDDRLLLKELAKIKKGDILVTEMTRPLYVSCMNKIAAIVTDRGGVLCHAVMVSREFNLPCIVNTAKATKILKNGQKVLVDADKGAIYEIQ